MTGMVKLAGLTEKTSRHGTKYLVGMLGSAKVVVCENREMAGDDDATHCVYLIDPTPQQPAPAPKPAPRAKAPPKRTAPKRDAQAAMRTHPAFNGDWQRPIAKGPGDAGWDGLEDKVIPL